MIRRSAKLVRLARKLLLSMQKIFNQRFTQEYPMAKTVADVMKMVQENEVKFVDFRFTDTRGKQQHTTVPVSHFDEDKFSSGHAFDGSSIAGWKGIEASDMLLVPIPIPPISTLLRRNHPHHALRCGGAR